MNTACLAARAAARTAPGLLQALADASNGDVIDLTGPAGTITLTSGSLQIEEGVTITGPGPDVLTISGNHAGRIFTMYETLDDGENVTISGLTIDPDFTG